MMDTKFHTKMNRKDLKNNNANDNAAHRAEGGLRLDF